MSDIADRYRRLADSFEATIAAVPPERWGDPSPCDEWSARDVVAHVVDVHGMMLRPIERALNAAPTIEEDPLGMFRGARADVESVLDDREVAAVEYDGAFGRSKVEDTIDGFLGLDLVVHRWDLARSTGQNEAIDPSEVERIWTMTEGLGDNLRTPGVCGPEVPVAERASKQDRLLGRLGRDPTPAA